MSQALVVTELPPNWAAFVDAVAGGADPEATAKSLGYAQPKHTSALLLRHPTVRKALAASAQAWLQWRGGQLAREVVEEIMTDRDPKAKAVRAKMAMAILDRVEPPKEEKGASDKPLGEMKMSELMAEAARLRGSSPLPDQMRDVTPGRTGEEDDNPSIS